MANEKQMATDFANEVNKPDNDFSSWMISDFVFALTPKNRRRVLEALVPFVGKSDTEEAEQSASKVVIREDERYKYASLNGQNARTYPRDWSDKDIEEDYLEFLQQAKLKVA